MEEEIIYLVVVVLMVVVVVLLVVMVLLVLVLMVMVFSLLQRFWFQPVGLHVCDRLTPPSLSPPVVPAPVAKMTILSDLLSDCLPAMTTANTQHSTAAVLALSYRGSTPGCC